MRIIILTLSLFFTGCSTLGFGDFNSGSDLNNNHNDKSNLRVSPFDTTEIRWILRREECIRQNRIHGVNNLTEEQSREETWKRTVADMQGEIHALQMTVVRLQEELTKLQKEKLDADI